MNDLTTNGSGSLSGMPPGYLAKLKAGIAKTRVYSSQAGGGGKMLLRLGKHTGLWVFGQDNEEYQTGAKLLINPVTLQHGWVLWQDGVKKSEIMDAMVNDLPPCPPPIDGKEPTIQYGFELAIVDGDDAETELLYKTPSDGGKQAVDALLEAFQAHEDEAHPCPLVELGSTSYIHPKYGLTYKPLFHIVGWADSYGKMAEGAPAIVAPVAAAPASVPAKSKKAPLSSAVASEPTEPAPTAAGHVSGAGQRKRPLK